MKFIEIIKLDAFYIEIGPEKWVTIPSGYDGISLNNGNLKILSGGRQYHLPHIGDKFVKMIPKTIQTDRLPSDIDGYIKKIEINKNDGNDLTHYLKART